MEKYFVPYEIALALKEIGFNEEFFAYYGLLDKSKKHILLQKIKTTYGSSYVKDACPAPLYDQVIDWFEKSHDLQIGYIKGHQEGSTIREYFPMLDRLTGLIDGPGYSTRKEALDISIQEAIKFVKKQL